MGRYEHVLLGGAFIGVLSALPVVNFANCCCLWVIAGGVLTAWLQQQSLPRAIESGEAAVSGVLAGLIGAVLHLIVLATLAAASGGMVNPEIESALRNNPQVPPEVRDMALNLMSGSGWLLIVAAVTLPVYAIVAAVGALVGAAIFRKKSSPPPADV